MKHWVVGLLSDIRNVLLIAITAIASAAAGYYWIGRVDPREELIEAAEMLEYRVADGRITGWPHRPKKLVRRGSESDWSPNSFIASAAVHRATKDPHVIGLSLFLNRDWRRSIESLHTGLQQETQREQLSDAIAASRNATLLSDLAAVHHALGHHRNRPYEFVVAAEAADRAWRLQKTPEIAWNRALTIESLSLRAPAIAAWNDYLALDGTSRWAEEARKRLVDLRQPTTVERWAQAESELDRAVRANDTRTIHRIVTAFPDHARKAAERGHLPQWAKEGGKAGDHRLQLCRAIGRVLHQSTGESLLYDTLVHFDAANGPTRARIVRGLALFADALDGYGRYEVARVIPRFREAITELESARSPFARLPRVLLLHLLRYENDAVVLEESGRWLADGSLRADRYPAIEAQLRWVCGLSFARTGQPQAAIAEYERVQEIFVRLNEADNITAMHQMLSEPYDYIGDVEKAWQHRFASLARLGGSGARHPTLLETMRLCAIAAWQEGFPSVATLFLDEHVAATNVPSLADLGYQALLWRSLAHRARGNVKGQIADVRAARSLASTIVDPAIRAHALNAVEMVRDRLSQTSDPLVRQQILDEAVAYSRRHDLHYRLSQLYLMQGLEHIRTEQWEAAEKALVASVEQFEEERETLSYEQQRSTFVTSRQNVYRVLVSVLCRRGEFRRAWEVVERSRARTLAEQVMQTPAPSRTLASLEHVQSVLPPRMAIVEFGDVGDALGVWIISARDLRFVPLRASPGDVDRLAEQFRIALRKGDEQAALRVSDALYDAIVRPWYARARTFERLVIIADGAVASVPFAALRNGMTGQFLIQHHVISTAPSANVFVACATRARVLTGKDGPLLIMAPSTRGAGRESTLNASRAELVAVRKQYDASLVLEGPRATRSAFLASARSARIIHFAGHTRSKTAEPPRLVFAGDEVLHANEVRSLRLNATELVVLAACDSASDRFAADTQGISSLARAFLAAGVPTVVASYWDVEDDAAADLSRRFHLHLRRGHDPAAALRFAQLQLLTSSDARSRNVSSWAAYAVIGEAVNRER